MMAFGDDLLLPEMIGFVFNKIEKKNASFQHYRVFQIFFPLKTSIGDTSLYLYLTFLQYDKLCNCPISICRPNLTWA